MLSEEEFRIRLLQNMECDIFGLKVKSITLDDILNRIGFDKYKQLREFVNLTLDTFQDEIAKEIENYVLDKKEVLLLNNPYAHYDMSYDLFDLCLHVPFINKMFIEFLNTFTYCTYIEVQHIALTDEMLIVYFTDKEADKLKLNRFEFVEFMDFFSILNFTTRVPKEHYTESESVKEFDRKAKEIKEKYGFRNKSDITLESIISSLVNSGVNYTHENIRSKTMYQIIDSFNRICKIKENEFMNLIRVNKADVKEGDVRRSAWYYNIY